jgi:hypothetical protein
MLSCNKVGRLLCEAQDRKLSTFEKMNLKLHLTLCKFCRQVDYKYRCMKVFVSEISIKIEEGEPIGEGLSLEASAKIQKLMIEFISHKNNENE